MTPTRCEHDAPAWACRICKGLPYWSTVQPVGCTCPIVWNGIIPPSCRVHNPPELGTYTYTTTTLNRDPLRSPGTDEPSCCEYACYEDPGCACDGCEGQRPAHVTPVGCWLLSAGLILAVIVAVVRRVGR